MPQSAAKVLVAIANLVADLYFLAKRFFVETT
jgi:hypothetical protein